MSEKIKKHPRLLLVVLIVICMCIIAAGGLCYLQKLQDNLANAAIQDVMNVTMQQRQSFDGFISRDRDRLHGYAKYFSETSISSPIEVQNLLTMVNGEEAGFIVMCLEDGWACSSAYDSILQMGEKELDVYRSLSDNGVRNSFVGMFSGAAKFGYYETFTFNNGHKGLIEKVYDRNKPMETFTLSLYDGEGFGYILERDGGIILRSVAMRDGRSYENIFDALADIQGEKEDIDTFRSAMEAKESGSIVVDGGSGQYVYTYTPLNSVDDWYLLSVVPVEAIRAEGDAILQDTQTTLGLFAIVMVLCAVFALLIWNTHRDIAFRDRKIAYQTEQFDVFTTYLSCSTDDMYIMLDHETGAVEYISPNVERVLGVRAEELIDYLHTSDMESDPEAAEAYNAQLGALRPGDAATPRYVERINPRTGERKYFLESDYCASVQGHSKRVCCISDRTREQKSKNDLSQALQMAQAANDAKSAFLSSVSHDIRTPMNAIIGFLTLMRDEAGNPEAVLEYTQRIDSASRHLLELINDVLDMNKIESGGTTLSIAEMNLAEVIDEINNIIQPQAEAKGQAFDIFAYNLKYERLMGDKMRINQILINLLSNAVKYTPEGGKIEMRVEELPQVVDNYSRVRFTVSDNGIGMSEDYLKVIFDPFTREETKAAREIQGTGLGMAITKRLVDLMGGTIRVESRQGEGSVLTVELELRIQEGKARESSRGARAEKKEEVRADIFRGMHILVVDDIDVNRLILVKILSTMGARCDTAVNGQEAFEKFEASKPGDYDLILMDVQMPVMDGHEATRAIRGSGHPQAKTMPVIAMTANAFVDDIRDAIDAGMNAHIAKPVQIDVLKSTIQQVLFPDTFS